MRYVQTVCGVQEEIGKEIDRIYDMDRCRSPQDLKNLLEHENMFLLQLRQNVYDQGKQAVLKGLKEDRVPYPELFWAERVGTKIGMPTFPSIRQYAPVAETAPPGVRGRKDRVADLQEKRRKEIRTGKAIAGVGGAGTVAAALLHNPIQLLLLALGIAATVGGCVLWLRTSKEQEKARKAAREMDLRTPEAQVKKILSYQRENCKKVVGQWCKELMDTVGNELEGYGKGG